MKNKTRKSKDSKSLVSLLKRGISIGLISIIGYGCGGGSNYFCPDAEDMLRTRGSRGISNHTLGEEDDYTLDGCGFEFYQGHAGGTGDTLEWINWDDSIYMGYAYDMLMDVSVGPNFVGQTSNGLKIGDNFDKFIEKYPDAIQSPYREGLWGDNGFSAYFNESGNIESMNISFSDPDNEFILKPGVDEWLAK